MAQGRGPGGRSSNELVGVPSKNAWAKPLGERMMSRDRHRLIGWISHGIRSRRREEQKAVAGWAGKAAASDAVQDRLRRGPRQRRMVHQRTGDVPRPLFLVDEGDAALGIRSDSGGALEGHETPIVGEGAFQARYASTGEQSQEYELLAVRRRLAG